MLKSRLLGAVEIVMTAGVIVSVSAQPAPSAFEVASLRLNRPGDFQFLTESPLGQNRWTANQAGLVRLLVLAFDVKRQQIVGVPNWALSERYAVSAKAEDGVLLTRETLAACLQAFLTERFKLATHFVAQPRKGYALVVAKSGPKMKAAKDGPVRQTVLGPGSLYAPSIDMHAFASVLDELLGQPVADETGLTATYDFTMTFEQEGLTFGGLPLTGASTGLGLPDVFGALEQQLGLKLETRAVPVRSLVIEHVERPTED